MVEIAQHNVAVAFGLTLFAGLATGLGSLIVFVARRPNPTLLSFGLGFSGGVMVYVSLVELLPQATNAIAGPLGLAKGSWVATGCFFGGILISALIDSLVPELENPHEVVPLDAMHRAKAEGEGATSPATPVPNPALARMGLISALAIAIHNVPEGMATFAAALADTSLGVSIAVAVAIHNVPEGIAVAVPLFFATHNRRKAFLYSFASGLAEPAGALAVYLVLLPFMSDAVVGGMLAAAGGIMVFISFDELLPAAREYGQGHTAITGVVLGMAVMALSLLLLL